MVGDQVIVLGGLISERALLYRLGVSSSIMFQRVLLPEVILPNVQDARYGSLRSSESTRSVLLIFRQRAGKRVGSRLITR